MSQIIRAIFISPSRAGISWNVPGSGIATISDSSIALNPVIDEPSKPIPSSRASSTSLGVTAKLFRCPSMSVNQSSRKSTFSSCSRFSASRLASGSLIALALLSTCAMPKPPLKTRKPQAPAAPEAASPTDGGSLHGSTHNDPCGLFPVAELFVDPPHGLIPLLRVRDEPAVAAAGGPCELRLLQGNRDASAAVAADDPRQPVIEHPGLRGTFRERRVSDEALAVERAEDDRSAELFLRPLVVGRRRHRLRRRHVGPALDRDGVHGLVVFCRHLPDLDSVERRCRSLVAELPHQLDVTLDLQKASVRGPAPRARILLGDSPPDPARSELDCMGAAGLVDGAPDSLSAPFRQHADDKVSPLGRIPTAGEAGADDPTVLLGDEIQPPGLLRQPLLRLGDRNRIGRRDGVPHLCVAGEVGFGLGPADLHQPARAAARRPSSGSLPP